MITTTQISDRLTQYGIIPENIEIDSSHNVYIRYTPEQRFTDHMFIGNWIGITPGIYLQRVYNPSVSPDDVRPDTEILYTITSIRCRLNPVNLSELGEGCKLYGLISPEGLFYECDYAGHKFIEPYLFDSGQFIHMFDEYAAGENSGWLKLTGAMMVDVEFTFQFKPKIKCRHREVNLSFYPTEPQINFIKEYAKFRNKSTINFNYDDVDILNLEEEILIQSKLNYE